ncbi:MULTISPECIES: hypothetical protein [unclassified Brevundimonas]|uniref:hypothetical protein n=1 Tax=unclassified Brevundimonas TaxID=2622653 RepID=UPI003F8F136B
MSIYKIAELVADRNAATEMAQDVMELSQAGLLNEWEDKFVRPLIIMLNQVPLSPRQASTLYHMWIERRRRTESDGVAISSAVACLSAIRWDLDDDERSVLDEVADRKHEFVQLADLNRIARVAQRHGQHFSPARRGWRVQSEEDERAVHELARDLMLPKHPQRAKRQRPQTYSKKDKGCSNDLTPLTRALDALEAALRKTSPQTG